MDGTGIEIKSDAVKSNMHRNLGCQVNESRQIGSGQQEMARVNTDILRISELKWTGMDKFNSDDHNLLHYLLLWAKKPLEEME